MFPESSLSQLACPACQTELPTGSQFCPGCGVNATESPFQPMATLGGKATLYPAENHTTTFTEWEAGQTFAERYEVVRTLGKGGMGTVYLAKDCVTNKRVAIKLLNQDRISDRDAQRLIDEGILARDIRHPNVVAVYDAGIWQDQPYITMEYLPGSTLRSFLRQQQSSGTQFSYEEAVEIVKEVLKGLAAAHRVGVVHRDLKPENIMLTINDHSERSIKILDFGIAKTETQSGEFGSTAGTLGYMSPEQFTSADLVGPSSDLYSISVLFYELLVGALPRGHWQPPSLGRQDVPVAIDQLIESGLANRAANRPESADAYARSIDAASSSTITPDPKTGSTDSSDTTKLSVLHEVMGERWHDNWTRQTAWWKSLSFKAKFWIITIILIIIAAVASDTSVAP